MLHILHLIERRRNGTSSSKLPSSRQPSSSMPHRRLLLASAIAIALGLALPLARDTSAQNAPPADVAPVTAAHTETPAANAASTEASSATAPTAETETIVTEGDAAASANAILDMMDAGDFAGVHARFDAKMAAAVSIDQLGQLWTTLPNQIGAAQGRGEAKIETQSGLRIARIPLRYERANLVAVLAFDANGKIAGFAIRPDQAQSTAAAATYAAPPLPANATFSEHALVVGDAAAGLGATLALPNGKGPFPAVVLVHGSGPQDRDETIGPNKPFLDIARGLAEHGIAVLRYDKRTKARPQDYANGIDIDRETTDDAVLAVAALRAQAKIDPKRIFVFGHSQGAMMAPRIAQRDAKIAGLVMLAAPSRSLLDIIIEQTRRMAVLDDGKTSPEESAANAEISRRVAAVRRGGEVALADSPGGLPVAYWRSIEAVDPVAESRALPQPMLILQGGTDIQVVDADWQGWKAAFHSTPRVSFKLYETLNHLAIPGTGTVAEYQTPGHVDPTLIADVAKWIGAQSPQRKKK